MKKLLIWGAKDQGTVTAACALAMGIYDRIDFLDFKEKGHRDIPGHLIYQEKDVNLEEFLKTYDEVIVATGDNDLRERKIQLLDSMQVPVATIVHPTAVISPNARVAKGTSVFANAVINTNASVGVGCIVNTSAIVEHDCVVGDYVNICPKAAMAGHTRIGRKTFLGIGSTVIDEIEVGSHVTLGAGAVVIKDIPDGVVAVGVPARIISAREG